MPGPDWMYHPIGLALALAGGLWLLWSLFISGRARGKPRCSKCWYDMTGRQKLTCPECGRAAKTPKGLLKTRRRWFQALASILVLLLAYSAWETPRIKRYGWPCALPNWALIAVYPIVDPPPGGTNPRPIHDELRDRLAADRLWAIDRWLLSMIVSLWIDDAAANPRHSEAVRMLTQCDTAPSTAIESLLKLANKHTGPAIDPSLAALARVAICDPRTRDLIDAALRDGTTSFSLEHVLSRRPRSNSASAAWLLVISRYFEPPDWYKVYSSAPAISNLGSTAHNLLPSLNAAAERARTQGLPTNLIEAAIAVVSGDAETDAEYWSRRLPDESALANVVCSHGTWTPETVANLRRALQAAPISSRSMFALLIELESHLAECRDLVPILRTAISQDTDSRARWLSSVIDRLEYPW